MSIQVLDRVESVRRLWRLLMPSCPAPDDPQLARWCSRFTDTDLGYAVGRTAVKSRRGLLADAEAAYRYTTGILINERRVNGDSYV